MEVVQKREVFEAAGRVKPHILTTPLYESRYLSQRFNSDIRLKLESYQPIGVFKIRGAMNKLLRMGESKDRGRRVIAASSGNHGLAVAYGARLLGYQATICVPVDASSVKVEAISQLGARIIRHGKNYEEAYEKALELRRSEGGSTLIHAFDDLSIIAGQGTIGLEILRQWPEVEKVVVPVGGGGLISGIAACIKQMKNECEVIGVQPKAMPSMYESLKSGRRISISPQRTIADGLATTTPGKLTFEHVRRYVDDLVVVGEEELRKAVRLLLVSDRVLTEPSGAASAAALLKGLELERESKVALVISGSNISFELLKEIISSA